MLTGDAAWQLVEKSGKILVASGSKVDELNPAAMTSDEVLARVTGRTGNLRAPALRRGKTFYIGYNDALYAMITS